MPMPTKQHQSVVTLIALLASLLGVHPFTIIPSRWPSTASRTNLCTRGASALYDDNEDNRALEPPPPPFQTLTGIRRVYCLSDLHTDHVDNMAWLREHTRPFGPDDLLLVAGDISHHYSVFVETLRVLRSGGANVFFIMGNHEAWVSKEQQEQGPTTTNSTVNNDEGTDAPPKVQSSFEKMEVLKQLCHQEGVHTGPLLIYPPTTTTTTNATTTTGATAPPLWVVPLEGWYDGTLSFDESLCQDFGKWPWVDFIKCIWTSSSAQTVLDFPAGAKGTLQYRLPVGLTEHLLQHNQANVLEPLTKCEEWQRKHQVMTVSHFLPNAQSLPDWKDLEATTFNIDSWLDHGGGGMSAKFAKVAGSKLLDDQIRALVLPNRTDNDSNMSTETTSSTTPIHIFGHSHRPKDFEFKGIRYIHNPLGKPRERLLYMISPEVDFQLVWDATMGGQVPRSSSQPLLRFWEEQGGGVEGLRKRMLQYSPRQLRRKSRYQQQQQSQEQQQQQER